MGVPIFQVDSFAAAPFRGNPAAVCLLPGPRDDGWMQAVAAEMNLSETAFLLPRDDGWSLRWYTPTVEVDICGHATLASAHVLWETGRLSPGEEARFHTRSGVLTAVRAGGWIEMDFPVQPVGGAAEGAEALARALAVAPIRALCAGWTQLVEVASESVVRAVSPDLDALGRLPRGSVIVTALSEDPEYDFVSRFFAPAIGIDEDPVTGAAHCILGPYWGERLGKTHLVGYQASARGGTVRVAVGGSRVKLSGQAVTTLRGELV